MQERRQWVALYQTGRDPVAEVACHLPVSRKAAEAAGDLLAVGTERFLTIRELPDPAAATIPPDALYPFKVTLRGTGPPIWRRLLVPAATRLSTLHRVLQVAMDWTGSHLHQFEVGHRAIGEPSPDDLDEVEDERRCGSPTWHPRQVPAALPVRLRRSRAAQEIVVEKVLPPNTGVAGPTGIAGERACPLEDVGGVGGYADFLQALQNPSHAEHGEMLVWIGGDFDPEAFDLDAVNAQLRRVC